ncbi:hypothetical protein [Rhodococcoides fascians]|nr:MULTISPECIES: hypothetical protein [Rhodococcus]
MTDSSMAESTVGQELLSARRIDVPTAVAVRRVDWRYLLTEK